MLCAAQREPRGGAKKPLGASRGAGKPGQKPAGSRKRLTLEGHLRVFSSSQKVGSPTPRGPRAAPSHPNMAASTRSLPALRTLYEDRCQTPTPHITGGQGHITTPWRTTPNPSPAARLPHRPPPSWMRTQHAPPTTEARLGEAGGSTYHTYRPHLGPEQAANSFPAEVLTQLHLPVSSPSAKWLLGRGCSLTKGPRCPLPSPARLTQEPEPSLGWL